MKLADIPPGSDLAYRRAAKLIAEQVEFELENLSAPLRSKPRSRECFELLATTPDWTVFLDDKDP